MAQSGGVEPENLTAARSCVLFLFMSDGVNTAEREKRILGELAELGLSLARAVHERALAAETSAEMTELALAFHRTSRSVRQTLALESKLERDGARRDREALVEAARAHETGVTRRKHQVRMAVERSIWTEAEGLEAERLVDELDDLLEEESLADDFTAEPVEAHVARIRGDLGLSAVGQGPSPAALGGGEAGVAPAPRRSSG
jgi:hypothetical protein